MSWDGYQEDTDKEYDADYDQAEDMKEDYNDSQEYDGGQKYGDYKKKKDRCPYVYFKCYPVYMYGNHKSRCEKSYEQPRYEKQYEQPSYEDNGHKCRKEHCPPMKCKCKCYPKWNGCDSYEPWCWRRKKCWFGW